MRKVFFAFFALAIFLCASMAWAQDFGLQTAAVRDVRATSAIVTGVIYPSTVVGRAFLQFQYGTAADKLDLSTPPVVFAGADSKEVSVFVGELVPDTVYYYRLSGSSAAQTGAGYVQTFKTLPAGAPFLASPTIGIQKVPVGSLAVATGEGFGSGTYVRVNGQRVPTFVQHSRQLMYQVPVALKGGMSVSVQAQNGDQDGNEVAVQTAAVQPRILRVVDLQWKDNAPENPLAPEADGSYVATLVAAGLGPVSNQPGTGEPARVSPLSEMVSRPRVNIGENEADVTYAGLAPGQVGLYQVNLRFRLESASAGIYYGKLAIDGTSTDTYFPLFVAR